MDARMKSLLTGLILVHAPEDFGELTIRSVGSLIGPGRVDLDRGGWFQAYLAKVSNKHYDTANELTRLFRKNQEKAV